VKQLRQSFKRRVAADLTRLVKHLEFIDESGIHLGLTRLCGRAAPGERVIEATLEHSGPMYTLVAAIGLGGVQAPWLFAGAMNRLAFDTYLERVLAPTLRPGDIVLLDNLSAHKNSAAQLAIEVRGAQVEFLPPYSPDLNPIE
jgi:hypothetical protein